MGKYKGLFKCAQKFWKIVCIFCKSRKLFMHTLELSLNFVGKV